MKKWRERLKQYPKIRKEISDLERRIEATKAEISKYPAVTDTVKESSKQWPYNQRVVRVRGKNRAAHDRLTSQLRRLKLLYAKLDRERDAIEEYITTLEDSDIRRIIRLHIIDGKTWRATARILRNNAGQADAIRKQFERFFGED